MSNNTRIIPKTCLICGDKANGKEYIHSREQKKLKRENDKKAKEFSAVVSEISAVDSTTAGLTSDGNSNSTDARLSLDGLESDSMNTENTDTNIGLIERYIGGNNNNTADDMACKALAVQRLVAPVIITDYSNTLNEVEGSRLWELQNAIQFLKYPSLQLSQTIVENFVDARRIFQGNCDQETRKLVKMSKSLTTFATMCESDQLTLLKYASLEIAVMRMIAYFDFDTQYWNVISVSL
ncbi:unnamed protein product [Medioppia subpectinata]|uniref:NR LBD domain-containing protein n=1 Tax=Medioppia subpectinata TaxID=1979941 RepID=A0A7R9PSS9_9ACAR|nr:unnamed protein product [Medioppia subpectinata]CAG2099956.1 unnamed protein product [Medioppia subpectinata]